MKLRGASILAAAVGLSLLMAAPAIAQPQGGRRGVKVQKKKRKKKVDAGPARPLEIIGLSDEMRAVFRARRERLELDMAEHFARRPSLYEKRLEKAEPVDQVDGLRVLGHLLSRPIARKKAERLLGRMTRSKDRHVRGMAEAVLVYYDMHGRLGSRGRTALKFRMKAELKRFGEEKPRVVLQRRDDRTGDGIWYFILTTPKTAWVYVIGTEKARKGSLPLLVVSDARRGPLSHDELGRQMLIANMIQPSAISRKVLMPFREQDSMIWILSYMRSEDAAPETVSGSGMRGSMPVELHMGLWGAEGDTFYCSAATLWALDKMYEDAGFFQNHRKPLFPELMAAEENDLDEVGDIPGDPKVNLPPMPGMGLPGLGLQRPGP